MKILFSILVSLLFYYVGLVFLTKETFEKKGFKLSIIPSLFIPIYIYKTFFSIALKHRKNSVNRNKALLTMFFGFKVALTIMIEVAEFGIENKYINKKDVVINKTSSFINKSKDSKRFYRTLDDYIYC